MVLNQVAEGGFSAIAASFNYVFNYVFEADAVKQRTVFCGVRAPRGSTRR